MLICLLALGAFQWKIHSKMVDFGVYRQASERVMQAEPLYRDSDGHYQFKYLPVFAVATIPFTLTDVESAKAIWFAASIGTLVLFLRFSARFVPDRRRGVPILIGIASIFMAKFCAHELLLGQVNLMFGLLAITAVGALQSELPAVAGVLFAASVCVKPYGILFAPWLLASEDRRATIAFAIAVAVALAAPAVLYGIGGDVALLRDWWHTVTTSTAPNLLDTDNVSFAALWAKWLGPGVGANVLAALSGLAGLGLLAYMWWQRARVNEPAYLEAAALLVLIPLLSPQGWDYVLLLSTPAVVLLIDRMPELSRAWRVTLWTTLAVMGLTIFDVIGKTAYRQFMDLSVVTLCAVIIVAALGHLRRTTLA